MEIGDNGSKNVDTIASEKNRFSYGTKLSWRRKLSENQYFDVWLYLEFKENDGKVERNFSANYFSTLFPKKCMLLS